MFGFISSRVKRWNRYNRTVTELSGLSNRELADLGLVRSDIQRVARESAS